MIHLLANTAELQFAFRRLSKKFDKIEIISAWLGNPKKGIPYAYLDGMKKIDVYAGISFNQTHPDGIKHFNNLDQCKKLCLIDEPFTFHMKLYHFHNDYESALIMGSSNFTLSGFTDNAESNVSLEGKTNQLLIKKYLADIKNIIEKYNHVKKIDEDWISAYTKKYDHRRTKLAEAKINDDVSRENNIQDNLVWLRNGTWVDYMYEFKKVLEIKREKLGEYVINHSDLLNIYQSELKLPWRPKLFDDENKRAMLLGSSSKIKKRDYGWLGHVGASGAFAGLLLNGSLESKTIICNSINALNKLKSPIEYKEFQKQLNRLNSTGPSIKVWGRVLAILKPELFYTISSDDVRRSLSILLSKPISFFEKNEGYEYVLSVIHNSPWYNSLEPKDEIEKLIWQNRCAFLDVIFKE
jgi:hypothetical protein